MSQTGNGIAGCTMPTEDAFTFSVEGCQLCAVLHLPSIAATRGVVVVVGGPQYRVGSHRQFTLLARNLASAGLPVLRFDYRGMGDSEGEMRGFEHVDADIRAAVDALTARVPGIQEVILWGLCDAASACVFYAHTDPRVHGMVLVNPWVRTEQGIARAYLTGYYRARVLDPALWRKLFSGRLNIKAAMKSFLKMVRSAWSPDVNEMSGSSADSAAGAGAKITSTDSGRPLPERMADGLSRFKGRVMLILSGRDLTAEEFQQVVSRSGRWRRLLQAPLVSQRMHREADHTFSRRVWCDQVSGWTAEWLRSW